MLGYPPTRLIEEQVPAGERVLVMGMVAEAYTQRDVLFAYQSAFNEVIPRHPLGSGRRGVPPQTAGSLPLPAAQVARRACCSDCRGQTGAVGRERVPRPGRATGTAAHAILEAASLSQPWDAGMAFDRNPATRWRSWESIFPGMYVTADFGAAETVDSVRLLCSVGQYDMRMRIDGQLPSGKWVILNSKMNQSMLETPPPCGAMQWRRFVPAGSNGSSCTIPIRRRGLERQKRRLGRHFRGRTKRARLYRLY